MAEIQAIANNNYILQGTVATSAGIVGDGTSQNPLRADETVLWNGTPTSAVTLSESMENFDHIRLYFDLGGNDKPKPVISERYSPVMTVSWGQVVEQPPDPMWGQGDANVFQTFAYITATPTAVTVVQTKQVNFGGINSTAAATPTAATGGYKNSLTKVVGVNRIGG